MLGVYKIMRNIVYSTLLSTWKIHQLTPPDIEIAHLAGWNLDWGIPFPFALLKLGLNKKILSWKSKSEIKFEFLIASQPRWSCKGQLHSESNVGVFKSPKKLTKFLTDFCPSFIASEINQGPLNTWTEHSNCQIHSRGDSKTPIASLIPNIFLIFYEIIFLCI